MTTALEREHSGYGVISNDTEGKATTRCQIGGKGVSRWKQLINGMHMDGGWNCVEHVTLLPGASIGEHLHARTEEIYYIVSGQAVIEIDGKRMDLRPGDLITTPIGARHTIANAGSGNMVFYVTEVFPREGETAAPELISVRDLMTEVRGFRGAAQPVHAASVDLTPYFTGDWHAFHEFELPAAGRLAPYRLPDRVEVLFVLDGEAQITVEGEIIRGGEGHCVSVPAGVPRDIVNLSPDQPLRMISTEVRLP